MTSDYGETMTSDYGETVIRDYRETMNSDYGETMNSDYMERVKILGCLQVVCFQGYFIAAGFHLKGI